MKRSIHTYLAGLLVMVPSAVLADMAPIGDPTPGCGYLSTDISSLVGTALVGIAVGIVFRSRRP